MKSFTRLSCAVLAAVSLSSSAEDLARHVDPFIGCSYNGHCFAAACVPFGMVQAGPDTGNTWWDYCSGYRFADTNIIGFSQTHLSGTGCGDLGDVRVMPVKKGFGGLTGLAYAKSEEVAEPGYYAVTLKEAAVRVEVAASKHSAIYRFNPLDGETPRLFVDLQYGILNWGDKTGVNRVISCDVRKDGDRRIVGTLKTRMWVTRTFHFAMEFDRPIAGWEDCLNRDEREKGRRFVLSFANGEKIPLGMKFGISAHSAAAAKSNLAAEIPDWDFAAVRSAAREAWNAIFSRVVAEGSESQMRTFYTSLYHLFIQPNDIADVGEKPRYSTFSTWDTFRAAHPFYTIVSPERVDDFVNSMLDDCDAHGFLPIWTLWGEDNQCMIGTHSVPIIVDAYLKGFRGFDAKRAWAAIKDTLTCQHKGRGFEPWDLLSRYGYIPFDKVGSESVSRTLEFAYDDWCAARFAEALGEAADARFFEGRSHAWTNVFDRTLCLARGRDSQGRWREPFNPFKLNVGDRGEGAKDFTEGNSWQYSWHVMQHPDELIAFHGGKEKLVEHLNQLFQLPEKAEGMGFALDATGLVGQYAHGNEPSHHTAYFFSLVGRPDRTAEIVREVCDRFYRPEPEGLCGNDDCGQMSAWYLFSAMGFYPFNPCGGEYVIGAPQVSAVQVKVGGEGEQRTFKILTKGLSKENKYVKSVTLNGKPVTDGRIRHADIVSGGVLEFEMWNGKSPTRVMCLGDSITHFGYCEYYLQLFENLRHPGSAVRYVNAGYSGGTVGTGLNRLPLETDRIRPDHAFVMFGMNDVRWTDYVTNAVMSAERRQAADKALATYRADLPKLVDRILASGVRDLTLVTPTPYDEYSTVLGPRRKFVNEYGLSLAAESVRRLAAEKGLKVVDLHAALTDACRANPGKKLCGGDSVHPGKTGHLLMASVYWRTFGCDRPVAAVTLDASGTVIRTENAKVSGVSATADALAFDYAPRALPFPDCPEYGEVKAINPDFARFNREPLVVVGLKTGDWELLVDGRRIGTFSSDVLSRGVNMAELDTPNRRQAAKAMEAAYKLHGFDVPRRDVACVRGSFEKFGVDMNDRDALAKCSKERLAKLKAENYRWYDWEKAASEKFLASVGREAEIAAEENRLYAAIAAPRPVTCRVEIRRTVKLSASGESTLTAYIPKGIDITAAVVTCPGGGYRELCDTYEGVEMAKWLMSRGIAAFVLRYRLSPQWHKDAMLADVRSALECVRRRAAEWRIDPQKVGVLGFSAGGHLACMAGTAMESFRPDFMALVYPHVSMARGLGSEHMRMAFLGPGYPEPEIEIYSGENRVTCDTPRTFIVHARTDEICPVEHSRRFAAVLQTKGRPVEYVELPSGRHGLGCGTGADWCAWLNAFDAWLRKEGLTK